MSLPKEILIQIIGYTLINPSPITLHKPHEYRWAKELSSLRPNNTKDPKRFKRTRRSPLLKILLVCRDFYFAGLEAYYCGNVFHFDSPLDFRETFVQGLSERHKACVKRIVLEWDWTCIDVRWTQGGTEGLVPRDEWALGEDLMEGFPELESVVVRVVMMREPVYFAKASRADRAKGEIERKVNEAWEGDMRKGLVEFEWPRSWGILKDM